MGESLLIKININCIDWIIGKVLHKLQSLEIYDLDNCVLHQYWKFDNIRLQPNGDIVYEILVTRLFGGFEK